MDKMTHYVEVKKDGKKFKVVVDGVKLGCSYSTEAYAVGIADKQKENLGLK